MKKKLFLNTLAILILVVLGISLGFFLGQKKKAPAKPESPKNAYVSFLLEAYDKIKENYWEKPSNEQLTSLYVLGTEKLTGPINGTIPKDKTGLQQTLVNTINKISSDDKKREFTVSLADIVLANLQPFGRSRLYSQKEETDLKNRVENKNPTIDQYQVLGVKKDAQNEEIEQVYKQKSQELSKETTPEAQQKLAQIEKARQILLDKESRSLYDQLGVEPTLDYKLLKPEVFYLHINKFSPTTMDELARVTSKVDTGDTLDCLILDLRNNVGGAIDGLPYFLGPFIGNDQYAYQFLHQGEKTDFKTKLGWMGSLLRYKKIVVLINEGTQSTAEVMAATLKKYNVGVLVGTTTRGWGTVEKVFELNQQINPNEKYSIFLVHSLTLREDGQPIEGKGIEPMVNIKNPTWEKQLFAYFNYDELIQAVKEVLKEN